MISTNKKSLDNTPIWKAKKKIRDKKKQGLIIDVSNSSQNWKSTANQIKKTQTRYKKFVKSKSTNAPQANNETLNIGNVVSSYLS